MLDFTAAKYSAASTIVAKRPARSIRQQLRPGASSRSAGGENSIAKLRRASAA
jgi:hypothetical protein